MSEALNTIHAYFGKLSTTTTKKVSQWAYGQKLVIHDPELPPVFEAYYSNSRSRGTADPQIGTNGVVDAPHAYFRSGADIYVFLMVHEGQDDGRYNKIVHIPIDPCSEPSDVEPEPYEQNVIDQAIAALNDAVEQTGEDKAATAALAQAAAASSLVATEAAQSAQGSATSASASASTASTAAATATTKASEAATSATNAANAKTAAETAETNAKAAQTASESAQASAESAAQTATSKASEASTSATSASGSASAASASASAASESAAQASQSATVASASATAAAGSATTASTKASEASASATAAQTAKTAAETAQTAAETAASTFETDTTLTVSGKAADAKVTGDAVNNLEGAITFFEADAPSTGLDANELLTNGIWQVRGSRISACSNLPSGSLGDIVIVVQELKVGTALQRLYDSNGNVWTRQMNTSTHEPITGWGWKNGLSGETGNSTQVGMTQKAVTDALALKADTATFNAKISSIEEVLPSEYQALNLSDATLSSGGIQGTVGSQIKIVGSTTSYCYFVVDNITPKTYKVTTKTSNSSKYPQYVIGTDSNNVVTELLGANAGVAYNQKDFVFTPTGATTKLYILVYSPVSTAYNYCKLYQNEIIPAASQKDISGDKYKINAVTDAALKNREISKAFANNTIKITLHSDNTRTPNTSGRELISGTTAVVNNHNATRNLITFGLITDTHKGGQRTVGYDPNYNITAFINATNSLCDFAVHGGDLITNYYDTNYMPDLASVKTAITNNLADFYGLTVPLLVTKGNHEIGLQTYSAISTPASFTSNLYAHDDETDTYYKVKTETEFNELKQAGATFYTETQEAMTNAEYEALVSGSYPSGAQAAQNNGAYYYWDFDNKLRIIVLNDFFVKTGGTTFGIDEDQLQFVSNAFDGALLNGLAVMTISHAATGGTAIASIALSYIANGGVYVGHIHGHEHSDVYINANGFNNIGVNWGCITIGKIEGHLGFAFDTFEIDLENKLLYEIRTGEWKPNYISVDRVFDFGNHTRVV